MPEPSRYERRAWDALKTARARPWTQVSHKIGNATSEAVGWLGDKVGRTIDNSPRLNAVRGAAGDIAKRVSDVMPEALERWSRDTADSTRSFFARASRIGLTPERVLHKHAAAGHDVSTFGDIRSLDLELVDKVRGRNLDLGYAGAAFATGAGTATLLTGGTISAGTGAGTAPGAITIATAIAADAAAVLAITSRAVGHIALSYGFDPEDPAEKLIVRAVINVGSASTAAARSAALQDLSKLSQLLYRGATWSSLNETVIARALNEFAKRFGVSFTKKTLGKAVPFVGIGVSATMNWATVESIIDEANRAYRRRFLVEKYPQLNLEDPGVSTGLRGAGADDGLADDEISIVDIVEDVLDDESAA